MQDLLLRKEIFSSSLMKKQGRIFSQSSTRWVVLEELYPPITMERSAGEFSMVDHGCLIIICRITKRIAGIRKTFRNHLIFQMKMADHGFSEKICDGLRFRCQHRRLIHHTDSFQIFLHIEALAILVPEYFIKRICRTFSGNKSGQSSWLLAYYLQSLRSVWADACEKVALVSSCSGFPCTTTVYFFSAIWAERFHTFSTKGQVVLYFSVWIPI